MNSIPIIFDTAIVATQNPRNPVGEAAFTTNPGNTIERLSKSISEIMDHAKIKHASYLKQIDKNLSNNCITRLSTNEFLFYTKEPLTLAEFEKLQNNIASNARKMPAGIHLVLGSFAVKTASDLVMNVTPHITCGPKSETSLIVKNHTSSIDVRYKTTDSLAVRNLAVCDINNHPITMPKISINGKHCQFSFNNIIKSKTPSGIAFLTGVDICLDHFKGVAKKNYDNLIIKSPELKAAYRSHMVISNCIDLYPNNFISKDVMHADPKYSMVNCKQNLQQLTTDYKLYSFGNDSCKFIEVQSAVSLESIKKINHILNEHGILISTDQDLKKLYTVKQDTLDNIESKNTKSQTTFNDLCSLLTSEKINYQFNMSTIKNKNDIKNTILNELQCALSAALNSKINKTDFKRAVKIPELMQEISTMIQQPNSYNYRDLTLAKNKIVTILAKPQNFLRLSIFKTTSQKASEYHIKNVETLLEKLSSLESGLKKMMK